MTDTSYRADLARSALDRSRTAAFFKALADAHVASRMRAVERELRWRRDLIEKAAAISAHPQMQVTEAGMSRPPGFWRRLLTGIEEARTRAADREIARFIQRNGGRIDDRIEREIERRFVRAARHD